MPAAQTLRPTRSDPPFKAASSSPAALFLALLLLCPLLGGCCAYESRWKAAAKLETTAAPAGIEGRWEGSWRSAENDHTGRLRCIVTRAGDDTYRADFHATFWKIFSYGYVATLTARRQEDGRYELEGDKDLGWLAGGVYHYQGTVTPEHFLCGYRSKYDHGKFDMTRPPRGCAGD